MVNIKSDAGRAADALSIGSGSGPVDSIVTGSAEEKLRSDVTTGTPRGSIDPKFRVRRGGGGGSSGRGQSGQVRSAEERAAQRLAQKRKELTSRKKEIASKAQASLTQFQAINKIQNALNKGGTVNPKWAKQAGIKGGFVNQSILNRRMQEVRSEISNLQSQEKKFNTQAQTFNFAQSVVLKDLQKPIRQSKLKEAKPVQFAGVINAPEGATPLSPAKKTTGNVFKDIILSSQEAAFGKQPGGTKIGKVKNVAGEGGIVKRTQETFFGNIQAGTEFGETTGRKVGGDVGAVVGRAAGSVGGSVIGTTLGLFEPGLGSIARVYGGTVERQTQSRTAGDLTEAGVSLVGGGLRGGALLGGKAVKRARSAIKATPVALEGLGLARSAAKAEGVLAAGSRGFQAGRILEPSIYLTRGERIASAVGAVAKAGQTVLRNPKVTAPLGIGASVLAPEVAQKVQAVGVSQKDLGRLKPSATQKGFENVRSITQSRGANLPFGATTASLGGELGVGAFRRYETLGGLKDKDVKSAFERAYREEGFSPKESKLAAKTEAKLFRARQTGVVGGLLSLSTGTELAGSTLITPIVERSVVKSGVVKGIVPALKTGGITAIKTAPQFIGLGAVEGFVGTAITDIGQQRAKSVTDVPRRIAEDPATYLFGTGTGAVSAPALGLPIVGLGVARTVLPTKSVFRRGTQGAVQGAGYLLDPFEEPGDFLAGFFGKREPSFRIRSGTIQPTSTETSGRGKGVVSSSSSQANIQTNLQTVLGTPTPDVSVTTKTSIGVSQPNSVTQSNLGNIIGTITPSSVPVETLTDEPITETTTETNVPVPVNISFPVATPISRAGVPFLFPPGGSPSGGRRGGRKGRTKYVNELQAAFKSFQRSLGQSTKRKRKRR